MKKLTISLTGGLGNQLFQYAAGIYFAKGKVLKYTTDFGKPRSTERGEPHLAGFKIQSQGVRFRNNKLSHKLVGFNLRLGVFQEPWEPRRLLRLIGQMAASFYLTLVNKRKVFVQAFPALGYEPNFVCHPLTDLLVGYFQNCIFAQDVAVRKQLHQIRPLRPSDEFLAEVSKMKSRRCLVVHLRLGDYKLEEDFGVLPDSYYSDALEAAFASSEYDEIWLFSDEPGLAIDRIPKKYEKITRAASSKLNPVETLELMRNGCGYVIANSTFSWWGAFLSYDENARVYCPQKWFQGMEDPEHLIPENWIKIRTW